VKLHYERPHEGDEKFIQNFGRKAEGKTLGRLRQNLKIILLKCVVKKQRRRVWTEFYWFSIGAIGGLW
jgi:hypothetical protein